MQATLVEKINQQNNHHTEQFLLTLKSLPPQNRPNFSLSSSGCRQKSILMGMPIYRITICIGFLIYEHSRPISLMITASHNPASDNGIKIGWTDGDVLGWGILEVVEGCVNCGGKFGEFVERHVGELEGKGLSKGQGKELVCFIGRDSRTSSPQLSKIATQALELLNLRVVDLGICTTPQLYSLSKQILQQGVHPFTSLNINKIRQNYVKETVQSFQSVWKQLHHPHQPPKLPIYLDFSNGSGSISYLHYKPHLAPYFQIHEAFTTDLANPNFKCGAQYFYKNWHLVTNGVEYEGYSECFFFDGDSDRIIVRVQDMGVAFDGNYFTVFYVEMLKEIVDGLRKRGIVDGEQNGCFGIEAVGTIVTNQGVKQALEKLGVELVRSSVGVSNLYSQAIKSQGLCVFFQPNGHGGIFISPETQLLTQTLLSTHPSNLQLQLLHSISKILKNNSRGYGLHNMLVYYLAKKYLGLSKQQICELYVSAKERMRGLRIGAGVDGLFRNGVGGRGQLVQPKDLCLTIAGIAEENGDYQILVRKSATEKCLVRVNVQGTDLAICDAIIEQIKFHFHKLGYLQPQSSSSH